MDMVGAPRTKNIGSDYSHAGEATKTSCNCRKDQGNFQQEYINYSQRLNNFNICEEISDQENFIRFVRIHNRVDQFWGGAHDEPS